jgi:hypothetical protein
MKKLALLEKRFDSEIIHISEACKLKIEKPFEYEKKEYYDIIKLRPMFAVTRNGGNSSFSYKSGYGSTGHGNGSKGIAHELVQEYVCRLKEFEFEIFKKKFKIKIREAQDEYPIKSTKGTSDKIHFIDCMLMLDQSCEFYELFDGRIGIEVTDKHDTTNRKLKLFEENKLFVLELEIIRDWHIRNDELVNREDIMKLRARIKGYLNNHSPKLWVLYSSKRI